MVLIGPLRRRYLGIGVLQVALGTLLYTISLNKGRCLNEGKNVGSKITSTKRFKVLVGMRFCAPYVHLTVITYNTFRHIK